MEVKILNLTRQYELIRGKIEKAVCEQMGRTPPWAEGLLLRADGYTTEFYRKD